MPAPRSRTVILSLLFTLAVVLLVGCAQPAVPAKLTVLEWAYYEVPEMWVEFGQEHP